MKLIEITFKKGNLIVNIDENSDGSYSIDITKEKEDGETYNSNVARFRTDEVSIEDLIEALQFAKDYNFIQKA